LTGTLEDALVASGCDRATVVHRLRLLTDNGSSYVSGDLADWLRDQGMDTSAARRTTRRPKARSSAGTRP
jgi:transposase InsO family protein